MSGEGWIADNHGIGIHFAEGHLHKTVSVGLCPIPELTSVVATYECRVRVRIGIRVGAGVWLF